MAGRWVARVLAVLVIAGVGFSGAVGPAAAHTPVLTSWELPLIGGSLLDASPGGERPEVPGEPAAAAADRATAPAAIVTPMVVSAAGNLHGKPIPIVIPRAALPWKFEIARGMAARFGEQAVAAAARQWDGIPGSRWATAYQGLTDVAEAAADGSSVIFLKHDCDAGIGGLAYWQTDGATIDQRYGTAAWYVTEVDIAVCSGITDTAGMRQTLAHEVGHAFGLGHFCEQTESCWQPGMGSSQKRCRVMYAWSNPCGRAVTDMEHSGAIHVYPRLERLAGPGRTETAARASYAAFARGTAATVVLARADQSAHGPLAGAAVSGSLAAPFLIGVPSDEGCVGGATAEELARVAAPRAQVVLVGDWPASCEDALLPWGLSIARVEGTSPVRLGVAVAEWLADAGRLGRTAFLVSTRADEHGHVPDGIAAGAAAGAHDAPVLFTEPDSLSEEVRAWLSRHPQIERVYLLGGRNALADEVAGDLSALNRTVDRVAGADRVGTAVALASRPELFADGSVVLAAAGSWADAVTGSAIGGRTTAPVLVTPPGGHPLVADWLRSRRPSGGIVVGGSAAVPFELQWRYSPLVR